MSGLIDELQSTYRLAREIRRYDRDRLGYIEHRRRVDGKNFFMEDRDLVVTDGATARKILAETNTSNFVVPDVHGLADNADYGRRNTAEWMPGRSVAHAQMRRKQAAAHARQVERSFDAHLRSTIGHRVDVADALKFASGVVMSDLMLGPDADGIPAILENSVLANLPVMNSSVMFPAWLPLPSYRRRRQRARLLRTRIDEILEARFQRSEPEAASGDILRSLIASEGLTRAQVRRTLQVSLLASFGVPGAAAAWSLLKLGQFPDLEAEARREARRITDPDDVLEAAPLLTAIVKEALRLYPPAWMITRLCAEPVEVGDLSIPPGCTVNIILYSIHRDEAWDAPDSFVPDRWLRPKEHRKGTYLPFGAGPRVCIGSHLGMIEIVSMLRVFLATYELTDLDVDDQPVVRALLTPRRFSGRIHELQSPSQQA